MEMYASDMNVVRSAFTYGRAQNRPIRVASTYDLASSSTQYVKIERKKSGTRKRGTFFGMVVAGITNIVPATEVAAEPAISSGQIHAYQSIRAPISPVQVELLTELKSFSDLEEGWDGEGSIGPTKVQISRAERLLLSIPDDVGSPDLAVSCDGTIDWCWISDNGSAVISVVGDRVVYYGQSGGHTAKGSLDVSDLKLSADFHGILRLI